MSTFGERVIEFNKQLTFNGKLPAGIRVMNPFRENQTILPITAVFYNKFYNDNNPRKFIIGINPGRLGAGATGIPFTDTKRLASICNIKIDSFSTHEPSSVFVYDMIEKYGGVKKFYSHFYINSICPLGFTERNKKGREVNRNYYDDKELYKNMKSFIVSSLKKQISFGIDTRVAYILGKKNAKFFAEINSVEKLFDSMVILEHPRFIEQYKSKEREKYMERYIECLK